MKIFRTAGAKRVKRFSLRLIILLMGELLPLSLHAGQSGSQLPSAPADTTVHSGSKSNGRFDTGGSRSNADSTRRARRKKVSIYVTPDSAADASITIVRKSEIESDSNSVSTLPITPDTIGTLRAPLSMALFQGDYDFVATRPGFRQAEKTFRLDYYSGDSLSINMFSLAYLRRMRKRWGTYKWISAGVATGAGLASWYFYGRIGAYKNEYGSATTPSEAISKRNAVKTSQTLYTVTSAIAFSAVASFLTTWLIQTFYHQ